MDKSSAASLYIDDSASLASFCEQLQGSPWLALDTEFIRERTYYPRLCLLQVGTPEVIACIDPLAELDLTPLLTLLYDPAITKVLHAAQQDLEIFYHLRGAVPSPIFDTQIAATVLGQGDQVGYATLAQELLGINLDKSQVRTDWSRRPLSPEQISYAADDVRYLCKIYTRQLQDLQQRQRQDWLREDFQQLSDPAQYRPNPAQAWTRIKGHGKLKSAQLVVLRTLADWREQQAIQADKPRRWICDDNLLLDLARIQPANQAGLDKLRNLPDKLRQRHGQTLLELIAQARQTPREEWPVLAHPKPLSPAQDAVLDALVAIIKYCAAEHDISPTSLASRRELEQVVRGQDTPLLHGWRKPLAGERVQAFLNGQLELAGSPSGLQLQSNT
ncbi:MAG: ribonuclease D [Candidatus Competibacteraceae bacterium]|nr:ribonuclease D [Candidatus Competibacteraceae bacterium]